MPESDEKKSKKQTSPNKDDKKQASASENQSPSTAVNGAANTSTVDEKDDDSRKLFVGGLHWETTEENLKEYFSKWGKVTHCIIKLDRYTRNSRGFGFVTMESEECIAKVLAENEHKLNGNKIDPKKAKPSREPLKKIFVGGIDPDLDEESIKKYFSQYGAVEGLEMPFDATKGKRKRYIFVSFTSEVSAKKAIAKERQEICGRMCDVRAAVSREQASRQKAFRQWYNLLDPGLVYPGLYYPDYSYGNFDPYSYGYYNFDMYNLLAQNPANIPAGRPLPVRHGQY